MAADKDIAAIHTSSRRSNLASILFPLTRKPRSNIRKFLLALPSDRNQTLQKCPQGHHIRISSSKRHDGRHDLCYLPPLILRDLIYANCTYRQPSKITSSKLENLTGEPASALWCEASHFIFCSLCPLRLNPGNSERRSLRGASSRPYHTPVRLLSHLRTSLSRFSCR